jgi:hypothetical protein
MYTGYQINIVLIKFNIVAFTCTLKSWMACERKSFEYLAKSSVAFQAQLTLSLMDINSNESHCMTLGRSQPVGEHRLVANPTQLIQICVGTATGLGTTLHVFTIAHGTPLSVLFPIGSISPRDVPLTIVLKSTTSKVCSKMVKFHKIQHNSISTTKLRYNAHEYVAWILIWAKLWSWAYHSIPGKHALPGKHPCRLKSQVMLKRPWGH